MKQIEWFGCYADSWQGEITPEAFSHPAKYSRGLITRIYDHMLAMGYVQPGDTIGDPFGGVALGAIHAMLKGLHWRGVELEPKFVELGNQNLALWQSKYGDLLRGMALLVQGDSRQFLQHVAGIGAVVSSPAYADVINGSGEGPGARTAKDFDKGWGANGKSTSAAEYGRTPGNLGNMDAVVSSAPFENGLGNLTKNENFYNHPTQKNSGNYVDSKSRGADYGDHPANIGNDTGNTFWQAAAEIVAQAYAALKPGAYAAWVCGDYVRGGERVYFGRQWLELCESVGFVPVEHIVAWKREPGPIQLGLLGDNKDLTIDRVSFFRRLANQKNPESEIVNEDVYLVRKPENVL